MRDVKPIEIEVMVVDKVIPNVLVDEGSGLNILQDHTMKKLGLCLAGPSSLIINMANQSPAVPLGMIKDYRISTGGEEYVVIFHVIKMHSSKDTFLLLLGRPWLRMSNAIVDWGGVQPSITYDNRVKIRIGTWGGWVRQKIVSSLEDEDDAKEDKKNTLIERVHSGGRGRPIYHGSGSLGSKFYDHGNDGEYVQ